LGRITISAEEHQRIDCFQWARLSGRQFLEHGVCDSADQVGRDIDAIEFMDMTAISRVLIPRAYIEMILSSKSGNRRWYLAISAGSKLPARYRRFRKCRIVF
jgi:hypothetical protein